MLKEVKIGAICFPVVEVKKLIGTDEDGKSVWCNARFIYNERRIEIDSMLDPDIQPISLLHEILHGILQNAGQENHPEPFIRAVAHGMVQVLRDNPELATYLVRGEDGLRRHDQDGA